MADPITETTTTSTTINPESAGGVPPATNVIATATSGAPSPAVAPTGTTLQGTPQNATTPPSNPVIDDFDNYATGNEILDNATKSLGMLMGVSGAELAQIMSKALQHGDPSLLDGTLIEQKYPQYKEPLKQLTIAHIQQAQQHQKAVTDTAYGVAGSKENWDMAVQVFKKTAPQYLYETVKAMINSGKVKEGAEMIMQTVAQNGFNPKPTATLQGGGVGGVQGLSYDQFKQEMAKLSQEAGNRSLEGNGEYARRYQDLLARRHAGRLAGL